jgi:putative endonuclease
MILRRASHLRLGRRGERYAARWLKRRGYRILARNLVRGRGEADILAETVDREVIALVEVKTRRAAWPPPRRAIDRGKRERMSVLAAMLRRERRFQGRLVRLEVIEIVWPERSSPIVRHYRGV